MKVYCANNNIVYDSPTACAEDLGLSLPTVSLAVNGKRARAGVYILSPVDDQTPDQLSDLRRWLLYSVYKIVLEV